MSASLRSAARAIFTEAMATTTVGEAVRRYVHLSGSHLCVGGDTYDLAEYRQVLIVSIGKAGATFFDAVRPLLPESVPVRAVVCAPLYPLMLRAGDQYFAGGHPMPNEASLACARAALALLALADSKTLVLFLISGGASAMCELPLAPGVTLDDLLDLNRLLVGSGAAIHQVNCVRKHLSAVKGGRLALAAGDAAQLNLLISDVPTDMLDALGSGPTLPDTTTLHESVAVVEEFLGGVSALPMSLQRALREAEETPKPGDPAFARSRTFVLLDNNRLVEAAAVSAATKGFVVAIDDSCDNWDYRDAASYLLRRLEQTRSASPGARRICLLSGGEVTVRLPEKPGRGGRNQQWALDCAQRLYSEGITATLLSAGSDGIDGHSPAAGCVADETTWLRALALRLDPSRHLAEFNAYPLFEQLGDSIVTGPSGNNLRDLRMFLAECE